MFFSQLRCYVYFLIGQLFFQSLSWHCRISSQLLTDMLFINEAKTKHAIDFNYTTLIILSCEIYPMLSFS